jgi:hypothetical protein
MILLFMLDAPFMVAGKVLYSPHGTAPVHASASVESIRKAEKTQKWKHGVSER